MNRPSTLERAFELAQSGRCKTLDDIRAQLKAEGLDRHELEGKTLLTQLHALLKEALSTDAKISGDKLNGSNDK